MKDWGDPVKRFWSRVDKSGPCWIFRGADNHGYMRVHINGRGQMAHRVSYEWSKGAIPEGLTIDHLCRNRRCVNPEHLEAVTIKVNLLRGEGIPARNIKKTHCSKGHPFDKENTFILKNGGRACKECTRIRNRIWYTKNREHAIRSTIKNQRLRKEKLKCQSK